MRRLHEDRLMRRGLRRHLRPSRSDSVVVPMPACTATADDDHMPYAMNHRRKPQPVRLHRRAAEMTSGTPQGRDERNQSGQEAPIVITPRALARLLRQIVTVVRPKSGMIKRKP
jgi:hypothetical protein